MVFQQRKVAVGIAYALGLTAALGAFPAAAQDVRVEVTGSNIKRVDVEGPQPVTVITREDIERRGANTLAEVLRSLPAQGGFTFNDQSVNSFAPGTNSVGLRNLGQNVTLVLVNGRRVANYGFGQNIDLAFVDLNSLPTAAIERIEVLKDGASAIYGSDAIAGVVNVILRKDFKGVEVSGTVGSSERGDGEEYRATFTGGWGDLAKDKFNAMITVDWFKRGAINLADRDYTNTADYRRFGGFDLRSPSGSPGTWVQRPGTNPGFARSRPFPQCEAGDIWVDPSGGPGCAYDFVDYIDQLPKSERTAVFGRLTWDINKDFQFFAEASYNNNVTNTTAAPTPTLASNVPVGHNSNPWSAPVDIRYRYLDGGARLNEIETDTTRLLGGLRGSFKGWDWEVGALWSKSDSVNTGTNYINAAEQAQLVTRGVYNFLNPERNSPTLVESLKASPVRTGVSEMTLFDARASGPIWKMPAGDLMLAVGTEYREDELQDTPDPLSRAGLIVGSGGTSSSGSREIFSAYAEFSVPILKTLEAQLAVRYDDYSDFGDTTNPKVALRWQPTKNFMLRGSYAEGFRAPSLVELYLGNTISFPSFIDTPRCNAYRNGGGTTAEIAAVCRSLQYRTRSGGNPDLDAETSESYYAGFVWEPVNNFSIALDWWRIKHSNIIDQPTLSYQLNNPDLFPNSVNRFPRTARDIAVGADGELHGSGSDEVVGVDRLYFNMASQEAEGIDFEFRHRGDLGSYGRLTSTLAGTYNIAYDRAANPGQPLVGFNGTYRYPRWRGNLAFDWERGPWGSSLFVNYIHSYDQQFGTANGTLVDTVDSWTTVDWSFQYRGFKNWTLIFGIKNLLDEDAPFSDSEQSGGFDLTTHNMVGRYYYGKVKYAF